MSKFIFVRHGQSVGNAEGYIATAETKLSELGIKQARETAKKLQKYKIDTILCSPMIRAQQTAETIAAEIGIDIAHIQIIEELRERYQGELEGKPKQHQSHWYYALDTELHVESQHDLVDRMTIAIGKINKLATNGKRILIVGHAISGYYLIELASGRTKVDDFEPPEEVLNAAIVEVEITKNWGEL
jgi:broad specificity phosphatase PhoE